MKKAVVFIITVCILITTINAQQIQQTDIPSVDEITVMLRKAEEICGWFTYGLHFPWEYLDGKAAFQDQYGVDIYPISKPEFNTKEKFDSYMLECLSEDMVKRIYERNNYTFCVINGVFCYEDKGLGRDCRDYREDEKNHEIISVSADRIVYRLTLQHEWFTDGEPLYYDYYLEKNQQGRWVFTNFNMPFDVMEKRNRYNVPDGNPYTADIPVIIPVALALFSAIGAGYVLKKHKTAC